MEYDLDAIDNDVLLEAKNLMKARWPDLVNGYVGDATRYVDGVRKGLGDNDADVVSFNAHSLKSSSSSLGLTCVGDIASDIEDVARDAAENGGDISSLNDLLPLIEDAFRRAITKLQDTIV